MKILLTLALLFCLFAVKAQTVSCSHFKNGKFKTTTDEGYPAIVVRNGAHEVMSAVTGKDTIRIGFNVQWVDDCTCKLTFDSLTMKKFPQIPKKAFVTMKMTDLKPNSYTQVGTTNISDKVFSYNMELLPDK
jgi:hypothetical protein